MFHSLRPPLYEASSIFSVSLNFNETGQLTQFEEDFAWNSAGGLMNSTSVLDQVAQQASQLGISTSLSDLKQITSIERKEYIFVLRVRHPDARTAATIAGLWADEAEKQLEEAYGHAQKAQSLRRYQNTLVDCLSRAPALTPVSNQCTIQSLPSLQAEIQSVNASLTQELLASRNIIPAISFALSQRPVVPTQPITRGTNSAVLAGALIGFLVGLWVVQARIPILLARSLRRA
jgi:protein-tyrosine-phosphatase